MATVIRSIGIVGIEGYPIAVQVKLLGGVAVMNIVGLGDQAVKEAKDRIESALDHLRLEFPKKKIVVNLSPSDIKKSGTYLDLPMLIGLLIESDQLHPAVDDLDRIVFLGEVGLSGEMNHFHGVLPMVIEAKRSGFSQVVLPRASLVEASRCKGIQILGFDTLSEVLKWLEKRLHYQAKPIPRPASASFQSHDDFSEVTGHRHLLKFITAAAAGAHNLLRKVHDRQKDPDNPARSDRRGGTGGDGDPECRRFTGRGSRLDGASIPVTALQRIPQRDHRRRRKRHAGGDLTGS